MHESWAEPDDPSANAASDLDNLVENAIRCHRLARRLANPVVTQQLVELGQEYASQALAQGADPTRLPAPDEWVSN